jgi:hypothetical protein
MWREVQPKGITRRERSLHMHARHVSQLEMITGEKRAVVCATMQDYLAWKWIQYVVESVRMMLAHRPASHLFVILVKKLDISTGLNFSSLSKIRVLNDWKAMVE